MYQDELRHEARLIAQGQQLYFAAFAEHWKRLLAWFGIKA
jgi:hypothetical protein